MYTRAHGKVAPIEDHEIFSMHTFYAMSERKSYQSEGIDQPRARFMLKIIAIALVTVRLMEARVLLTHKDAISARTILSNPMCRYERT